MTQLSGNSPHKATAESASFALYTFTISFDRLIPGVDNLRHDVYLSPVLCAAAKKVVRTAMAKYAQAEDILNIKISPTAVKEREAFKRICGEILQEAVHIAKSRGEIQIDYLSQAAVFKLIIETNLDQYTEIVENFQRRILAGERAVQKDVKEIVRLKERLSALRENRSAIIRQSGLELFQYVLEVHRDVLVPLRTVSFGKETLFPNDIFLNPMLHATFPPDDKMMLETYTLLGRRIEDPDRYDSLLSLIKDLVRETLPTSDHTDQSLDQWLKQADNLARLTDASVTRKTMKKLKKEGGHREARDALKQLARTQEQHLRIFFRQFRRAKLIKRICAAYQMLPICSNYCPPLQPRQVLQFLTERKTRRFLTGQLKAYGKIYGKVISLGPLRQKARELNRMLKPRKQMALLRFFDDFSRYHRDEGNYHLLSEAMGQIHLITDSKTLDLSRANKTLFEFLLPHERAPEEKPIIHHVILKADVRGATDLAHRMIERRLNPASFFSLNFFEPISAVLSRYGASKVFIEGDAVILSILEHEAEPSEWYAVARACGLAVQILMIIERYNQRSRQNELPVLEVGCGISYLAKPPAFLFDGDSRIMISQAINHADRMSSCTRTLRNLKGMKAGPFHLRVLQTASEKEQAKTRDDLCIRYNVNGIELNAAGFEKLAKEIKLKAIEYTLPGPGKLKTVLYTGKFPTVTGQYQRLIVREARIPEVSMDSLRFLGWTHRRYYEVCTHPDLFAHVRSKGDD
ncbi:MAG: hypothetical protein RBT11_19970 [Desulfobacterales bacterium]|jgi:hypothetical protein|nr:hypothetical protein [Desulfobacterales bacterium]